MKYDVFVSYSRYDYWDKDENVIPGNIVSQIVDTLETYKRYYEFEYFFDQEAIESRAAYLKRISAALDTSKVVLFVASANSYASDFCAKELNFADKREIPIFQYCIDDAKTPLDIELLLGTHQFRSSKHYPVEKIVQDVLGEALKCKIKPLSVVNCKISDIEMVFVKGGTFTMGATSEQGSDAHSDEKPTRSVTLSDYYIGKYEVTQAQWREVMGDNPSDYKGDDLPVENVSWNDVQVFIQRLNEKTGKHFRLPTEAEWEYAARGGNQSKGYKYSGSNTIGDVAWYIDNSSDKTHPVGQKKPNELGIYDMSGNVWEWCSDRYGDYSSSSQTNPTGPSSGSFCVSRGGCHHFRPVESRVSSRNRDTPDKCYRNLGFRLACSPRLNMATSTVVASTTKTYKVGDYYNDGVREGVVFEVSTDGKHGKIVSMMQSKFLRWTSDDTERRRLIGADSETDGAANMAKVKAISGWQDKFPAFKWCADLGEGWYLPAKEELVTLYWNKETLNLKLKDKLLGKCWSSTEYGVQYSNGDFCAWRVGLNYGSTDFNFKNFDYFVRAVSVF